ncbi:hypothetical protein [Treponema sp.]|uniref:hypothetical protein n=1 Tax=Treponema sp. TaxID=166 RepID=UPI00388FCE29
MNSAGGRFGLGYVPINSKKYILAFHGFSEIKGFFLDYETKYKAADISERFGLCFGF